MGKLMRLQNSGKLRGIVSLNSMTRIRNTQGQVRIRYPKGLMFLKINEIGITQRCKSLEIFPTMNSITHEHCFLSIIIEFIITLLN